MKIPARGFTLIELLVVIAIIGVLSSVVLASLNSTRAKARDAQRLADMHAVVQALELYALQNDGTYPPTVPMYAGDACGNSTNVCLGNVTTLVTSGYLSAMPKDPKFSNQWNYLYCRNSTAKDYILLISNDTGTARCRPRTPFGDASTACPGPPAWATTYPACQ